ncbi:hypothetical protein Poli38472_004433 [Pythium oligandrum]|uniref:Cytochrome P450 n=1 Tax=Pythium oligandrum TaxID=41045 RepID=A0A8K1C9T7_PYTOL|nr:hypothetical protein Poli38472_004433 [Pythium oligandrum]|eukprot:TMW59364.1 hypothetical protein Poli38472_004433 [Pythium oligandrum]
MLVIPPSLSDNTILVAYGALAVGLFYVALSKKKHGRRIHNPDSTLPILGNLLDVTKDDRFHDWMLEQCVKFKGEPWQMNIPGDMPTVIMYTPEMMEEATVKQFDT